MKAWWPGQGDWGTQFGMLIQHLEETRDGGLDGLKGDEAISDLQALYKAAKARFDAEPDFKLRAREAVTRLQAGEPLFLRVRAHETDGGYMGLIEVGAYGCTASFCCTVGACSSLGHGRALGMSASARCQPRYPC